MNLYIRQAVAADVPVLTDLIHASVRALQAEDYTEAQREAALRSVFGVDSQLIADGTYFVVQTSDLDPVKVGCGGWSKRRTLYGGGCPAASRDVESRGQQGGRDAPSRQHAAFRGNGAMGKVSP